MSILFNDSPENWQFSFQEEASPISAGISDFHNYAMGFLIGILIFVSYFVILFILSSLFPSLLGYLSYEKGTTLFLRHSNHSSPLEFIWTIIPGLILILIALPSLSLLYALDDVLLPHITLNAIGHQWYWSYELNDLSGPLSGISFDSYTLLLSLISVPPVSLGPSFLPY